jgi:hypothetical protein
VYIIGKVVKRGVIVNSFTDVVTGKVVLEVGTDNTEDYYPYCVMNWSPENLACNVGR